MPGCPGLPGCVVVPGLTEVGFGTVSVTVLVLVLVPPGIDGTTVVALPVVVLLAVVELEVVGVVVVAVSEPMTPQATRLPASPVARVSWSGPGAPLLLV